MDGRWSQGEVVVLREQWDTDVFEALPGIVVEDGPRQTVLFVPGSVRCRVAVDAGGRRLRIPDRPWRLEEVVRGPGPILSFAWPGTPYAVLLLWDADWRFLSWYVNLETPLRRSPIGFDYTDHALDVLIAPDRSRWEWKDEDELVEAIALGLFTEADAAAFHAAGERAIEHVVQREPPFDREWDRWRPDPSWPTPELPEDGLESGDA
jgi:hypothetical protein